MIYWRKCLLYLVNVFVLEFITFKQDENKRVKKVEIERYEWEYHDGIDKHKVSNIKMQCANIRNEDNCRQNLKNALINFTKMRQ
jgi:hypothetical protein